MKHTVTILAVAVFVLASCRTAPTDLSSVAPLGPVPPGLAALDEGGPWRVDVDAGTFESEYGCTVDYERYTPVSPGGDYTRPAVVLAHGFLRDLQHMRGWAKLWAGFGVETIILSFCNSRLTKGNHDRNAADLLLSAQTLLEPQRPVIYAGYSAGGLSALLATAADPRAVAYLGLDPVDSGKLAASVAEITVPTAYLFGEPSDCNARQNMMDVIPTAPSVTTVGFRYATHCDFEMPTDNFCTRLCGRIVPPDAEKTVRLGIRTTATAWILQAAGVLPADTFAAELILELQRSGLVY